MHIRMHDLGHYCLYSLFCPRFLLGGGFFNSYHLITLAVQVHHNRSCNLISEVDRNSVSNHFVSVVCVRINKLEIIRETLYTSYFTNGHSPIKVFLTLYKTTIIFIKLYHLRSRRMQLALTAGSLNCKALFIPRFHTISAHKDGRKCTSKIFIVIDSFGVMMVLQTGRNSSFLKIPNNISKRNLLIIVLSRPLRESEANIQIFTETNIENSFSFFCNAIILCVYHCQRNIISCFIEHRKDILNSFVMTIGKHTTYIFSKEKLRSKLFKDSDVIIEKLTSCIFNASQRTSFRPRLTRRTADDTINFSVDVRSNIFLSHLANIAFNQMCFRMVYFESLKDSRVKLVRNGNMEACSLKSEVKTSASRKQRNYIHNILLLVSRFFAEPFSFNFFVRKSVR